MVQAYQDNLQVHDLGVDISASIQFLLSHSGHVTFEQWEILKQIGRQYDGDEVVPPAVPFEAVVYDANFSMADELQAQIMAVRAIRDRIMTADGQLSSEISTREAKEVVSSGSTLLGSLMKFHEKVVNMERLRLLESSVVEVLGEQDEEIKDMVLHKLEEKLQNLE